MVNVMEEIERNKILAELLARDCKKVFIKTVNGDLYFGDILLVGEDIIRIECFAPQNKAGGKFSIYWASIIKLDEYKQQGEMK